MRSVVVTRFGGADVIEVRDVPVPEPGTSNVWNLGVVGPGVLKGIVIHGAVAAGTPEGTVLTSLPLSSSALSASESVFTYLPPRGLDRSHACPYIQTGFL